MDDHLPVAGACCGQDWLRRFVIRRIDLVILICAECDSVWLECDDLAAPPRHILDDLIDRASTEPPWDQLDPVPLRRPVSGVLTGGPLGEIFRTLSWRFGDLSIERLVGTRAGGDGDGDVWRLTRETEDVDVRLDARPGGRPPFLVESGEELVLAEDVDAATVRLTKWLRF